MRYSNLVLPVVVILAAAPVFASVNEMEARTFMTSHEQHLNNKATKEIESQLDKDLRIIVNGDPTDLGRKDFIQVMQDAYKNYQTYKAKLIVDKVSATPALTTTEGLTTETFTVNKQSETVSTKWKYTLKKQGNNVVVTKMELFNP